MNARTRASVTCMQPGTPPGSGFKRQVVIRVSADEWPLLEQAAAEHGSLQAALLAGLRALARPQSEPKAKPVPKRVAEPAGVPSAPIAAPQEGPSVDSAEEIHAREAAKLLGLKTSTVCGYIHSGRIRGRYDDAPTWQGWMTTRGAVDTYQRRRSSSPR